MSVDLLNDDTQLRRKLLLTPCASKEDLGRWMRMYLGLDFPDEVIDDESTGSALDTLWEVYDAGVNNRPLKDDSGEDARRMMMYASRDSYKTLGSAALELLAMVHMHRSVVHLAAIEQQAGKAMEYLGKFLDREGLDEVKVGDNKRTLAVSWFEHKQTGDILTRAEWKELPQQERHRYWKHEYYAKVIVNTPQSANSDHVAFMVVDEVDLIRFVKAYDEAKLIPSTQRDVYGNRQPPITVLTSTRKYSGGLVQKELDEGKKTGTLIRHWNILDVTAACPPTRFKPDEPLVQVWRSNDLLRTISPEEYEDLKTRDPKKAETFVEDQAFAGCARCPIFAACRGRLTQQKSTRGLLKEVEDTIGKFKETSVEMAQAQLMCWKPGNEGAIFRHFDDKQHMLTTDQMWEAITGEKPHFPVTKDALIAMMKSRGMAFWGGMDFGFTHYFANVVAAVEGRRMFIFDAFEIPQLEPSECVDVCDRRIKQWDPVIWPDVAYPAYIKLFRKHGYKMREHKKDVVGGIEAVRSKLMPAGARAPEMFLLKGDQGCELLAKRIREYRWKLDAQGNPTDTPEEKDDDLCDALRYMVQNVFHKGTKLITTSKAHEKAVAAQQNGAMRQQYDPRTWMTQKVAELTGAAFVEPGMTVQQTAEKKVKRGSFYADFTTWTLFLGAVSMWTVI